MEKKISEEEVKTSAQSVITAKQKATDAKKAADDAGGVDEALNTAAKDAGAAAAQAESDAEALSQKYNDQRKAVGKMKLKKADIERELREYGEGENDSSSSEEEDDIDPDKPLTMKDLDRIEARKAAKTAEEMARAIEDEGERTATLTALRTHVNPALVAANPKQAFESARAIANADKNAKILEDANRSRGANTQRPRGAGAPANVAEVFEPNAEEQKYMRAPWNLSEADIKAARARGEKLG